MGKDKQSKKVKAAKTEEVNEYGLTEEKEARVAAALKAAKKEVAKQKVNVEVTSVEGTSGETVGLLGASNLELTPESEGKAKGKKKSGGKGASSPTPEPIVEAPAETPSGKGKKNKGKKKFSVEVVEETVEAVVEESKKGKKKAGKKSKNPFEEALDNLPEPETNTGAVSYEEPAKTTRTRTPMFLRDFQALQDKADAKGKPQKFTLPKPYTNGSYGDTVIKQYVDNYGLNLSAVGVWNEELEKFVITVTAEPQPEGV